MKTVEGYLVCINAETHLNKLGDDLAKYQEADQHEKEQRTHNAAGNNNHGNGSPFGNNMNYQTPPNNNQYDHTSSQ